MSICLNVKNMQKRVPKRDHEHTGQNYKKKSQNEIQPERNIIRRKCLVSAFSTQEKTGKDYICHSAQKASF